MKFHIIMKNKILIHLRAESKVVLILISEERHSCGQELNRFYCRVKMDHECKSFCSSGFGSEDVIYLPHRCPAQLDNAGSMVRSMSLDLSGGFNTIQPSVLRGKLERAGGNKNLATQTVTFLSNKQQYLMWWSALEPPRPVPGYNALPPLLLTPCTSDCRYSRGWLRLHTFWHCHCWYSVRGWWRVEPSWTFSPLVPTTQGWDPHTHYWRIFPCNGLQPSNVSPVSEWSVFPDLNPMEHLWDIVVVAL